MTSMIENQQQGTIPAGTWQADPVHSSVGFAVKYLGVATFSGELSDLQASLADGSLSGKAQVASIEVKDENLKAHLQAPEFFDAERHPELTFTGREVGEGRFAGELTIKGVTKPITLEGTVTGPVTDPYGNERIGLALMSVIDRTDFGLNWNAPLPGGGFALANDVTVTADLSLVKAA
jgi:polyisoprenoid-binding protein YceI